MNAAWFSALGEPLGDDERGELAGYLAGLGLQAPVHAVTIWDEAEAACRAPSQDWWRREEEERTRLERGARLDPADPDWLALNDALHGAAAVAAAGHPFLRKHALYCGGRWLLGVYRGEFSIF